MTRSVTAAVLALIVCNASFSTAELVSYPNTPTVTVTEEDTDYTKYFLSFKISVTPAATGSSTCGYNIELGISASDAAPLLFQYRPGAAITAAYAHTFLSVSGRWAQGTPTATTVTVTDADADGNDEVTVSADTSKWISNAPAADTYYVHVKAVNCDTNEAINPNAATATVVDKYYPYYAPLVAVSQGYFQFTDTNNVAGRYSGSLVIFTDPSVETKYGITGYAVHSDTKCTTSPGCSYTAPADAVTFTKTTAGKWTATLAGFAPVTGNQVYIVALNAYGVGVERQLRVTDFRPAPTATSNLLTRSAGAGFVLSYTPEKYIHTTNQLSLCFADQMKLGVTMTAGMANPKYVWQAKSTTGTTFKQISTADNIDTYGPVTMYPNKAGTYRVQVTDSDSTGTTPYFTDTFVSEELVVTVKSTPQWPESGVPADTLTFTDTNQLAQYISGTLTLTERSFPVYYQGTDDKRQFEYYLVYLSDNPDCVYSATDNTVNLFEGSCATNTGRDTTRDTRLGVIAYSAGTQTFTISNVYVGDVATTPKYIHVTAYETAGEGAESKNTATIAVVDVKKDSPAPVPMQAKTNFYDSNGAARTLSGRFEFYLDATKDYTKVDKFEVYQYTDSTFKSISELTSTPNGVVASFKMPAAGAWDGTTRFSMFLGTYDNELGAEKADPSESFDMDDTAGNHYDYLLVVSRTAANTANAALGYVASDTAAYVLVEDRIDSYYFISTVASKTGSCPGNVCPSGDPSSTVRFWPFAEQTESGNGMVTVYWLTAGLDDMLYEVDATAKPRLAAIMGNTALDDMSGIFQYDISLGSDSNNDACSLQMASSWPFGAPPSSWLSDVDLTQRSLFYITSDYDGLRACGFSEVGVDSIVLEGTVTLSVQQINSRTDSIGSFTPTDDPQLTIQAVLKVTFKDTTHASVASVSIQNVLVVDSIAAEVTLSSSITFYDEAFLTSLDTSSVVFTAGSDKFYIDHSINSNQDEFFMQLERMWFSPGKLVTDSIEYLVPQSSAAYTNIDNPETPGRYRFNMVVPYLMNCKPCYMHLVSSLSLANKKKKGMSDGTETTKSAMSIYVELTGSLASGDSASCATLSLMSAVVGLVATRF